VGVLGRSRVLVAVWSFITAWRFVGGSTKPEVGREREDFSCSILSVVVWGWSSGRAKA
jgi:hypothetical protein